MKKKLLFILMLVLVPSYVNALNGSVSLSCTPTDVKAKDVVTCTVKGNSDELITQFDSSITLSEGLSLSGKLNLEDNWDGKDLDDGKISVYGDEAVSGDFTIGSFKVVVGDNVKSSDKLFIKLENVTFFLLDWANHDYSGEKISATATENLNVSDIGIPETIVKISNITVLSGGIMSPAFVESGDNAIWLDTAETTKFKLKVDVVEGLDLSAKITGTDTVIDLNNDITYVANGDTSMSITITVTNGKDSKDYVLLVYRPKPSAVGDAVLETLNVGGYTVNLKSGQYTYSVTLSSSVITNGYVILAKLADEENFKFDNYSKSYINKTIYGENPIQLTIVPMEEGSGYGSNTYIINIVKEGGSAPTPTTPETPTSSNRDVPNNPSTGRASGIAMGIVLIVSFFASIYYYKKNMSEYN